MEWPRVANDRLVPVQNDVFYSDRTGESVARIREEIPPEVWGSLVAIIQRRLGDGFLARSFPIQDCIDGPFLITGTNGIAFEQTLIALVPQLAAQPTAQPDPWTSSARRPPVLDANRPPPTSIALDVVDFFLLHVEMPMSRTYHDWGHHEHLMFDGSGKGPGQRECRAEIELIFERNGIAFTIGPDMRVARLGPPEARPLLSDFVANSEDPELNSMLHEARARFLSRDPAQTIGALEKLWDAFERLKTLELGGDKSQSIGVLIDRAAPGSALRSHLEAECKELTKIGNSFHIRHFEHDKNALPSLAAVDYLFTRLAALIAFLLRQTGRM